MEEKIKQFFQGAGIEATEQLGSDAKILITVGETPYSLKITKEREVNVEKDVNAIGDVEIRGRENIMSDLLSSSSMDEFSEKMISYIVDGREPEVKILMKRTLENSGKFQRDYYYFLRKMLLLR